MKRYFTIGMAGHIDHGKTTLTKALTGVDTDRLIEEKERKISIEPGYAPFIQDQRLEVSIIDVPGHEKFIRQMIAGVSGIDMVILVIAADEGIMPQTREHLDILTLLGIENGFIVITKIDNVDEEWLDVVVDDVEEQMKGTFLEKAPIHFVDSVSQKGIPKLKEALQATLLHIPRKNKHDSFRLPIDQVFTVKGQGVIVRGTIYNGEVKQGERLKLLPSNKNVRVRQIQRHHEQKKVASVGQRAALNLSGISHDEITRGHVIVADDFYTASDRIDVAFSPLKDFTYTIKQRHPVKLYIGTSEVMGKIIFFDRNEVNASENEEILCQIQLNEQIVVARGDRFILRKPTPVETVGGGWVIEPNASKHRFGKETIELLKLKKTGSAIDRLSALMKENIMLTRAEIIKHTAISNQKWDETKQMLIEIANDRFVLHFTFDHVKSQIITLLEAFHERFPMRIGMNKAELTSELNLYPLLLIEFVFERLRTEKQIKIIQHYISLHSWKPTLPPQWKTKLINIEKELEQQGLKTETWFELVNKQQIPNDIQKEFYHFLIETEKAFIFDEERLISKIAVNKALEQLKVKTNVEDFNLQTARDILQLTRKNLIPLLELFDRLGYTKRSGNIRTWIEKG